MMRWLGVLAVLVVTACSSPVKSVTLSGLLKPPSAAGLASAAPLPDVKDHPLALIDLGGAVGKEDAGKVQTSRGDFSLSVRTDTLPAAGRWVKLAWMLPGRGGVLLERTYFLSKDQTGEISEDLTDLSTLTTLAIEAQRVLNPSLLREAPATMENTLVNKQPGLRSLQLDFQERFYAYLGGDATPPGSDANLAQDTVDLLFH